jgi:hypothetical protein
MVKPETFQLMQMQYLKGKLALMKIGNVEIKDSEYFRLLVGQLLSGGGSV